MGASNVTELGTNIEHVPLEYVYVTIPAEYICVYHRILAMLADYGEEMLKDCKSACKDRNSGVIECFNMFNAAVAARKLGKTKLAEVLIKYIKSKINQIYKGKDNSTSFVFPVDENGEIKAFVSCGETPKFQIKAEDGALYKHKYDEGFDEHFNLSDEDRNLEPIDNSGPQYVPSINSGLDVNIIPRYETSNNRVYPCVDIRIYWNGRSVNPANADIEYYFDDELYARLNDATVVEAGLHKFTVVVMYNGETEVIEQYLYYEN